MDNRKVYKSYREKVKGAGNHPYNGSTAITSKVKGLLGLWNSIKSANASPKETKEQPQPFKFEPPKIVQSMPGAFHTSSSTAPPPSVSVSSSASVLAPPASTPSTTTEEDASPNKILSKFFQEKGDRPLTDIEYEGVMSLMSKSKHGTPYKRSRINSIDETLIDQTFSNIEPSSKRKKTDATTPYTQKTLVQTPNITISTPEYNPVYHTIHNDTTNTSFNKSIPSIKRVYQFSGLPSPYRTRIKPPSFISSRRKQLQSTRANKTMNNIPDTTATSFAQSKSFVSGPSTSSTAKTLLSILDGKSSQQTKVASVTNDKLKLFSNPYGSRIKKSKPTNVSITANDIEKTILYDKSEPLPEASVNGRATLSSIENGSKPSDDSTIKSQETNGIKIDTKKVDSDIKTPLFTFGKNATPKESDNKPEVSKPDVKPANVFPTTTSAPI
ncbi:uncharacterized protein SPAPADRAFT_58810, partial [Spathaspora passalidarum NRRL Y-27907]